MIEIILAVQSVGLALLAVSVVWQARVVRRLCRMNGDLMEQIVIHAEFPVRVEWVGPLA